MADINIDVWLYGHLAEYGGAAKQGSYANLQVSLPEGSPLSSLLKLLQLPTEERGISFINGDLSAMPGLQPDLTHILMDGDRVALFDLLSMWPFQYRHGVQTIPEMTNLIKKTE